MGWALDPRVWCPHKKRNVDTETDTCRRKTLGRHREFAFYKSKGVRLPGARGGAGHRFCPRSSEGASPADTPIMDFRPAELGGTEFLSSKPLGRGTCRTAIRN